MPQSLDSVLLQIVFSTKDRVPFIRDEWLEPLHAHLSSVSRAQGCECYRVGGVADHVHVAVGPGRTKTVSDLVEALKTSSSKWMKTQSPQLERFSWQRGYGVFSFGRKDLDSVVSYIDRQAEHHRTMTFEEEYLSLLREAEKAWDDRYVWD
jgi:putative transposase